MPIFCDFAVSKESFNLVVQTISSNRLALPSIHAFRVNSSQIREIRFSGSNKNINYYLFSSAFFIFITPSISGYVVELLYKRPFGSRMR